MKGRPQLPGAVDLPFGARLTPDQFADLVLPPPAAALSNDSPRDEQDDD
jgi:hypothetical protein